MSARTTDATCTDAARHWSLTAAEGGGGGRRHDIDRPTLCPPGADPLDAVAAFGAVVLTGYAASHAAPTGGRNNGAAAADA